MPQLHNFCRFFNFFNSCRSIYGYHNHNKVFLKVFLYNPSLIKRYSRSLPYSCVCVYVYIVHVYTALVCVYSRLADLLLSGAILNQVLQPYEAHVPYILQVR